MPDDLNARGRRDSDRAQGVVLIDRPHLAVSEAGARLSAVARVDGRAPFSIWFQTTELPLTDRADPFVPLGLIAAMRTGCDLHIEGTVSPRQLRACATIQDIFTTWYPDRMRRVRVSAATAAGPAAAPTSAGAGAFFSMGADSFYTALTRADILSHLLLVHGFDVRRTDVALRDLVTSHARDAAARLGKTLVVVETTAREFLDAHGADWPREAFGAALASVALACQPALQEVHISSEYSYRDLWPHASHPALDFLWGTEALEIVHASADVAKPERYVRLADSAVAMDHLRVCWHNPGGAYNCGKCTKCLRARAQLQAIGALDRCRTYPQGPLTLAELWKLASLIDTGELERIQTRLFRDFVLARSHDPLLRVAVRSAASPVRTALAKIVGRTLNRTRRAPGWLFRRLSRAS